MRNRKCSARHLGESKLRGIVRDFGREANGSETPNRQIWIQYVCGGMDFRRSRCLSGTDATELWAEAQERCKRKSGTS